MLYSPQMLEHGMVLKNQMKTKQKPENLIQHFKYSKYFSSNWCRPKWLTMDVKVKSSEGSHMETDQTEQLDTILTHSVKVLRKK